MEELRCRFCARPLNHSVIDLGTTPLATSLIKAERAGEAEPRFPLQAFVCGGCYLMQLAEYESPAAIFSDYLYFSSFSSSWLEHARRLAEGLITRLALTKQSQVVEIASNDGYLLQWFAAAGIPVLGIEPAKNVAETAIAKGIPTEVSFFGKRCAEDLIGRGIKADLIVANNVLAHVPDIHDFISGIPRLLAADGVVSIEFPHLLKLLELNQFDTIYHEHFSYLSHHFVEQLFNRHGLRIFDIEHLSTHGGSLRILGCLAGSMREAVPIAIDKVRAEESAAGLDRLAGFSGLEPAARRCREEFNRFVAEQTGKSRRIAAYGAPAKGNTFLNYCGITSAQIPFTVDRNPHKQSCLLPGSRIPVRPVEVREIEKPDFVVILPWNLRDEISAQLSMLKSSGTKFVTAIPQLDIF